MGRGGGIPLEIAKCELVGMLTQPPYDKMHDQSRRVYHEKGLSPALHTCGGGNLETKVMIENPVIIGGLQKNQTPRTDGICPTITATAGMGGGNMPVIAEPSILKPHREYDADGVRSVSHTEEDISPSILATQYKSGDNQPKVIEPSGMYVGCPQYAEKKPLEGVSRAVMTDQKNAVLLNNRIRSLTETECIRLMDFDVEDGRKLKDSGLSKTRIYMAAGDSIVVGVLVEIFKQMIKENINEN